MHREGLGGRLRARGRARLAPRLAIDARALAALRVAVALLVLADLVLRAADLGAFYTDAGTLPRAEHAARYPLFRAISLHALSGDAAFQALLLAAAGGFALALLAGRATRLATAGTFALLASLDARNPLLLNGGDGVLLVVLFWGMFLPLGARWSADAGRAPGFPSAATAASAALLLHVVLVYVVNAAFKLRGGSWLRGEALAFTANVEHFQGVVALPSDPFLLALLGWAWLALLLASPLLLLTAGRGRVLLVGLFAAAHVGMALTLRLGLFPLISLAALLPFLPPPVWDALEARAAPWKARWPSVLRPQDRAPQPARTPRPLRLPRGAAARPHLVASIVVASLAWHAASVGELALPDGVPSPGPQGWVMFANPHRANVWWVAPGALEGGGEVDALHGGPVPWDAPPRPGSVRWLEYFEELDRARPYELLPALGRYLCERWNAAQEPDLLGLDVYVVERPIVLAGPDPPPTATKLLERAC